MPPLNKNKIPLKQGKGKEHITHLRLRVKQSFTFIPPTNENRDQGRACPRVLWETLGWQGETEMGS